VEIPLAGKLTKLLVATCHSVQKPTTHIIHDRATT